MADYKKSRRIDEVTGEYEMIGAQGTQQRRKRPLRGKGERQGL